MQTMHRVMSKPEKLLSKKVNAVTVRDGVCHCREEDAFSTSA